MPHAKCLEIMRKVLSGLLTALGHEIVGEAENGRDALALCREHHPDLVILDWAMNHINGDEAARTIRTEKTAADILFVTSQGQAVVRRVSDAVGAKYVVKPFRDQQIAQIVEEIAREQAERRSERTRECG